MVCRLCGQRRARRACPALGHEICAVCCGTKRQVEIRCPSDCAYLATAREHPAATAVRQQQRDLELAMQVVRDFNQRQSQVFFLVTTFIVQYRPADLHSLGGQSLIDEDVAEAAAALAATFETATRGVIYEHHAASAAGARLAAALKPVLIEAGQHDGTPFQRDAAVVLRRLEEAARRGDGVNRDNPRALVELLSRIIRQTADTPDQPNGDKSQNEEPSRLIVP
jgi:hypothetical protein